LILFDYRYAYFLLFHLASARSLPSHSN